MTTKIIIDSTTDLPAGVLEDYDIDLLPLNILLEEESYLDKVTIDVDQVYSAMREGVHPKTSLPSPGATIELFEDYAKRGVDFIFISFSSKMSSTFSTCKLIIDELKETYPQVKMAALDSLGGSFATGHIAWQAAAQSKAGYSFEEILQTAKENVDSVEHVFTIDDLRWLEEGGRLSKKSALVGSVLNIKPILDVQDGEIVAIDKVRGRKKAFNKVADLVEERIQGFEDQPIGIVHADDPKAAQAMKGILADRLETDKIIVEDIGSVLASHLGIGGVGVFFFNEKPSIYMDICR